MPAPWMRDYIGAMRAVWRCWQDRTPLEFEASTTRCGWCRCSIQARSITDIPIHVAVIGPNMTAMAERCRRHPSASGGDDEDIDEGAAEPGSGCGSRWSRRRGRGRLKPLIGTAPMRSGSNR